MLIIHSIFCLVSLFLSLVTIIILFCYRAKLKQEQYIELKLRYSKKDRNKLNLISWAILFVLLLFIILNSIPYTNKIVFSDQYETISDLY